MEARWKPRVAFLIGAWASTAVAQQPVGLEFQVNTYTTGSQAGPSMASDSTGAFVVVWNSPDQDGQYSGVFGQRFTSTGAPNGSEFRVNSITSGSQQTASVGMAGDGRFVAAWEGFGQEGPSTGLRGQRFAASGAAVGPEFQVNTYTPGNQKKVSVAVRDNGDFILVWEGDGQDDTGGVFAQRYTSTGAVAGTEFRVNTTTSNNQYAPAVAAADDGKFVVVWVSRNQDGSEVGVFGQRFAASGAGLGPEFQVNAYTTGLQRSPAVAMQPDGSFVVAWESIGQELVGSSGGIYAKRFGSNGAPFGPEFHVNTYVTGPQNDPSVAADGAGRFVIVWSDYRLQSASKTDVFGQAFDSGGAPLGNAFKVNTFTTDYQTNPVIGAGADGDFTVVWGSFKQDPPAVSSGVFGQRFLLTASGPGRVAIAEDHYPIILSTQSKPIFSIPVERIGGTEGPLKVAAEILFGSEPDPDLEVITPFVEWASGEGGRKEFVVQRPETDLPEGAREFRLLNVGRGRGVPDDDRPSVALVVYSILGVFSGCSLRAGSGALLVHPGWLNLLVLPAFLGWNLLCLRQMARARAVRCGSGIPVLRGYKTMRSLAKAGLVAALFWANWSAAGTFGFVSNASIGSLSVVDLQTGELLGRLAAGTATAGLRANPSGTRLYVADTGTDSVRVIDTSSGVMETVTVGDQPAGIAITPDGSRVYVANWEDGTVSVLDGATNTVLTTIPVGRNPGDLATDGTIVCVANFGGHEIVVLSVQQNLEIKRIEVDRFPAGVAIGQGSQFLYVSNFVDNTVSVVDVSLGAVTETISVGITPRGVLVDPSRPRLYVGNVGDGSISVIDTNTGLLVRTIESGLRLLSDLALSSSGDRLYAVSAGSDELLAFDPVSGALRESISLAATGHVAFGAILDLAAAPPVTPALSAPRPAWLGLAVCGAAAIWVILRRRAHAGGRQGATA